MPRTALSRFPELAVSDRSALDDLLDQAMLAHVGLVIDGHPVVIPTGLARDGDRIFVHGSTGSRWMQALASGVPAAVGVTMLEALVVARSAFESSMHYRSAVLFGRFSRVDGAEKAAGLRLLTDALIPGRSDEVRESSTRELAATLLLEMPIETWSMKVSDDWPEDTAQDVSGPAWAGVVPISRAYGVPIPAPDLSADRPLPDSVKALSSSPADAPLGGHDHA